MSKSLSRIDLNLLVALQVLLEERNVTKAAQRLFVTQPAMSKTLQRLRDLFEDPLFTRAPHGLVPTPRALELQQPLNELLEQLQQRLFNERFEASTAQGSIFISAPEMFALTTVPRLISQLRSEAPNLLLQSRNLLDQHTDLLASGALDFAINLDHPYTKEFSTYRIGSGQPGVWLRKDHPLASKKALEASDLATLPAVRVYLPDMLESAREQASSELAASGIDNAPILETTQLLVGLEVLYRENAYMLGPNNLGDSNLANQLFTVRPLLNHEGLENSGVELFLVQHQRTLNSPLHSWLRDKILMLTKMAPFA